MKRSPFLVASWILLLLAPCLLAQPSSPLERRTQELETKRDQALAELESVRDPQDAGSVDLVAPQLVAALERGRAIADEMRQEEAKLLKAESELAREQEAVSPDAGKIAELKRRIEELKGAITRLEQQRDANAEERKRLIDLLTGDVEDPRITDEKSTAFQVLLLGRELEELERELSQQRDSYQEVLKEGEKKTLRLTNLENEVKRKKAENSYLITLLSGYAVKFLPNLNVAELQRYEGVQREAEDAAKSKRLGPVEVIERQIPLLDASVDRLQELTGGATFRGRALTGETLDQTEGDFLLIGPLALFVTDEAGAEGRRLTGPVLDQPVETLPSRALPTVFEVESEEVAGWIGNLNVPEPKAEGTFLIDPTRGDAFKNAKPPLPWNVRLANWFFKGGPVMYVLLGMAVFALLASLAKWMELATIRKPGRKKIERLLTAVSRRDQPEAERISSQIEGPVGRMLRAGVDHLRDPRELVEEVMYEVVLRMKLRLQRVLPFIAICAAAAPLLGLLGTVTGIIETFKQLTEKGAGDVKSLSGGISEALITTASGLLVAIPALLLHAFLSRKARGVIGTMETTAVAFINQVRKTPWHRERSEQPMIASAGAAAADPELVRQHVNAILGEMLDPIAQELPPTQPGTA